MEENNKNVVIASDSLPAHSSIKSGKSSCRQDILYKVYYKVYYILFILCQRDLSVSFLWVPALVGIEGNEEADMLAKQSLKSHEIDIQTPLSRAEGKTIIKSQMYKIWQEYWDISDTGRPLYNIQKHVGIRRTWSRDRREETLITRLRIGHTAQPVTP